MIRSGNSTLGIVAAAVVALLANASRADTTFTAALTATQQVPPTNSSATGVATLILNNAETDATATVSFFDLSSADAGANIHGPAGRGETAAPVRMFPPGNPTTVTFSLTPGEVADLRAGRWYINVRSANFPDGEIRGQLEQLCTPPPAGLVAFYKGDSNANDSTAFGNQGAALNGANYSPGKIGPAFLLDGFNDFVSVNDADQLDLASEVTIAAWVRPNVNTGRQQAIVSKRTLDGNDVDYTLFIETDGRLAFLTRSGGGPFVLFYSNGARGVIPAGAFTHVAVAVNSFSIAFYVNGVQDSFQLLNVTRPTTTGGLTIGAVETSVLTAQFGGLIDEVQLFNRALPPGQIAALAGNGTTGVCTEAAPFPLLDGMLNPAFDADGMAVIPDFGVLNRVAIQPDGRIVAVGSPGENFGVVRLNPDGTLDVTFDGNSGNGNGIVTTEINGIDRCQGVALQPDGKIIAAGVSNEAAGTFTIVRYNADGTLDTSFDGDSGSGNGIVRDFTQPGATARRVVVQPDGKIIAIGTDGTALAMVRFQSDGRLDTQFGIDGRVFRTNEVLNSARGIALQSDGRIVLAGYSNTNPSDFAFARYLPNGAPDQTFDGVSGSGNGSTTFSLSNTFDGADDVVIQPDGRIVAAGFADGMTIDGGAGPASTAVAAIDPGGAPSSSFNNSGFIVTSTSADFDRALALKLQADGKLVVGGFAFAPDRIEPTMLRYHPDGSLDRTFDGDSGLGDGIVRTSLPSPSSGSIRDLALAPDGDIVAVGTRFTSSRQDGLVLRYFVGGSVRPVTGDIDASFSSVVVPGSTTATPLPRAALPPLPLSLDYIPESIVTDVRTSASFDGGVLVRFTLPPTVDAQTFDRLVVLQFENGAWFDRTVYGPDAPARDFASRTIYGRAASLSPWVIASTAPLPTTPPRLANISTRLRVERGNDVLIGGLIITGDQPKRVIIRATGPSTGVSGSLADPQLHIFDGSGNPIAANDNWEQAPNAAEIAATGIAPANPLESAYLSSLSPGAYTAVVSGVDGGTGIGLVEVYDLDDGADSRLANISTRGLVGAGDDAMIAGLIVLGDNAQRVIVRAIGPSLPVEGKLADPTLQLFNGNGDSLAFNNNWRETQEAEIIGSTVPPSNDLESAIVASLPAGPYTAVVRGVADSTGVALVEIYALQ